MRLQGGDCRSRDHHHREQWYNRVGPCRRARGGVDGRYGRWIFHVRRVCCGRGCVSVSVPEISTDLEAV